MELSILVLVVSFIILLLMNVPVAFCMGIASTLAFMAMDLPAATATAHKIATGIDSFTLLAIPFFILSGLLMGHGGIARRLIDFANVLVGRFRGGLAFVNILTCMFFGAISGSAAAAVSAVGGFMIPLMNKMGYDRDFNTAVTVTAATTGLLIPPSNVMIVYSLATGGAVSIAAVFIAGVLPGILVGLGLVMVSFILSIKNNYGTAETLQLKEWMFRFAGALYLLIIGGIAVCFLGSNVILNVVAAILAVLAVGSCVYFSMKNEHFKEGCFKFLGAFPAMLLIVIVMGGILKGYFTATEASAIAVAYSFLLALFLYREIKFSEIPKILLQCGVTTSVVFMLIGTSMAMSWVLAAENVPQQIRDSLMAFTDNKIVLLLLINLILLAVGTFMDMTPAVLIFTPIFLPIVKAFGMHPLHFGIIIIMNLCIGLCTPPVGTCLFLGCGIGETTVTKVVRKILPFFVAMVITLFLCTYIEWFSLWLPGLAGFLD